MSERERRDGVVEGTFRVSTSDFITDPADCPLATPPGEEKVLIVERRVPVPVPVFVERVRTVFRDRPALPPRAPRRDGVFWGGVFLAALSAAAVLWVAGVTLYYMSHLTVIH